MPQPEPPLTPSAIATSADAPASEGEVHTLSRRARRGVVILIARSAVLQLAHLGGTVLLARLLEPRDFGVFAVVQFVLSFFTLFGDAGLGGALIQQKAAPSQRQLSSIFAAQILLAIVVIGICYAFAGPVVTLWKDLPPGSDWLLRTLSLSLLLTLLRAVPSILMERELLFGRLSVIELVQVLSYYVVSCALAWMGHGIWSLILAVLVQGLVGAMGSFLARPWRPNAVFDTALMRPLLRFGIAFQVKGVVGFINGAVVPLYAGLRLGTRAVGFIEWAMTTAYFPLKLVEIMSRVAFPLFSRLQDRELTARTLERIVQVCAVGTLFMVGVFIGLGPGLVHVVFSDKWMPGLPLLSIFALAISIGFLSPLIGSALDAAGRPQLFAYLAMGWTALNWIATPIGTRWGMIGFAAAYSVHVVVGNLAVIVVLVRIIPNTRIWPRVRAALVACSAIAWISDRWLDPRSALSLTAAIVALLAAYVGIVFLLDGRGFLDALRIVPRKAG